jgi:hypothetical protein
MKSMFDISWKKCRVLNVPLSNSGIIRSDITKSILLSCSSKAFSPSKPLYAVRTSYFCSNMSFKVLTISLLSSMIRSRCLLPICPSKLTELLIYLEKIEVPDRVSVLLNNRQNGIKLNANPIFCKKGKKLLNCLGEVLGWLL